MKRIKQAVAKEVFQDLTAQAREMYKLSNYFCLKGDQKNAEYYADQWDATLCVRDTIVEAYPSCNQPYNLVDRLILSICKLFRR